MHCSGTSLDATCSMWAVQLRLCLRLLQRIAVVLLLQTSRSALRRGQHAYLRRVQRRQGSQGVLAIHCHHLQRLDRPSSRQALGAIHGTAAASKWDAHSRLLLLLLVVPLVEGVSQRHHSRQAHKNGHTDLQQLRLVEAAAATIAARS